MLFGSVNGDCECAANEHGKKKQGHGTISYGSCSRYDRFRDSALFRPELLRLKREHQLDVLNRGSGRALSEVVEPRHEHGLTLGFVAEHE